MRETTLPSVRSESVTGRAAAVVLAQTYDIGRLPSREDFVYDIVVSSLGRRRGKRCE
jgi:hypothetical protein